VVFRGLYATTHFAAVKRGRYRREPGLDKPRPSALCSMLTAPSRFPHYAFSYAGQAQTECAVPMPTASGTHVYAFRSQIAW
jgi:hypothetical protein